MSMEFSNQLQKVKKIWAKNGKCSAKVFFYVMIFSLLGTLCGVLLAYGVIQYLYKLGIYNTQVIIWVGTGIGIYFGNTLGGYCRNRLLFLCAMLPSIIVLELVILHTLNIDVENGYRLIGFYIAIVVIAIPLFIITFRSMYFCEKCKKKYESITVFSSKKVSPYQIKSLLQNKQEFPDVSDLEEDKHFPRYKNQLKVEVNANYCPQCYDAVVDGALTYTVGIFGKEERELFFIQIFGLMEYSKKYFQLILKLFYIEILKPFIIISLPS